jgi:hypothetical protein
VGPGGDRLYQRAADTCSAPLSIDEHPDQHSSVTPVRWIVCEAGCQPEPSGSLLGNEGHAISPGGPTCDPLVPDRISERVFSSKRRAECHGRIAEGAQAQGSQLEPFLWSNPATATDREVARAYAGRGGGVKERAGVAGGDDSSA